MNQRLVTGEVCASLLCYAPPSVNQQLLHAYETLSIPSFVLLLLAIDECSHSVKSGTTAINTVAPCCNAKFLITQRPRQYLWLDYVYELQYLQVCSKEYFYFKFGILFCFQQSYCVTTLNNAGFKRQQAAKVLTHHLYFCMRDFGYFVGEDIEIYFSLYDAKKLKFIR